MVDTQKLEKLKSILQLVDESISKKDFEESFKILIDFVKKLKEATAQELETIKIMLSSAAAKMENDNQDKLVNMKSEAMNFLSKEIRTMMAEHKSRMTELENKAVEMKSMMPDEDLIAQKASKTAIGEVLSQIPKNIPISEEIPKLGDLLANTVSGLLEINDIKGLKDLLEELKIIRGGRLGGGGVSKASLDLHFIDNEIPVDSGDHLTFTIANTPSPESSFKLYRSRARQNLTEDYTLSGKTLTLTVAFDSASESLYCDYKK